MAFPNQVSKFLGHTLSAVLLCSLTGCVTTTSFFGKGATAQGPAQRIDVLWHKDLVTREDVVNRGQILKGIAARAFVFGADGGHPLRIDGDISVSVFDTSDVPAGGQPRVLEQLRIPRETAERLAVKDQIGWGYNLFVHIPASKLTPEVRRLSVHLQYTTAKGETLLAAPATITLGLPPSVHTTRQTPAPPSQPTAPTPAPRWPI